MKKRIPLGPYRRPIPGVLGGSQGGGRFRLGEVLLYILHPIPFILHPAPYTLHPTPYTLHPTSYTRCASGGLSNSMSSSSGAPSLSLSHTHTQHTHTHTHSLTHSLETQIESEACRTQCPRAVVRPPSRESGDTGPCRMAGVTVHGVISPERERA